MEESSPYARPIKHMNAVQRGVAEEELYDDEEVDYSTQKASDRVQDQNLSVKQLYKRYSGNVLWKLRKNNGVLCRKHLNLNNLSNNQMIDAGIFCAGFMNFHV